MDLSAGRSATGLRPDRAGAALLAAATAVLVPLTAVSRAAGAAVALSLIALLVVALAHATLLRWTTILAALAAVVMLIPIRRYSLPGALPFELEPYRIVVAGVFVLFVAALLAEPLRARSTLAAPLAAFGLTVLASVLLNAGRIASLDVQPEVVKKIWFFATFLGLVVVVATVVRTQRQCDLLVGVLVAGGALLGASAVVEWRTGFNPYDHLHRAIPVLEPVGDPLSARLDDRGGHPRAYASAQHAISLGALLAMLVPLAAYLALRSQRKRWWAAAAMLVVGMLATLSRTGMAMLGVELVVLVVLRPQLVRRLWPAALPLLVAVHVAMPGTLGTFKKSFFPEGGLIAQQQTGAGTYGSGRIADLGPALAEWSRRPILGQGFGSRITVRSDPKVNAPILDNQWLALLLETGLLGAAAFAWLLIRPVRRLFRLARAPGGARSLLATGLAASISAYGVAMTTMDAFAFVQLTVVVFLLIGLAGALLPRPGPERNPPPDPR